MKKVWVNRFNADGTLKPMSEWVQRECAERYTHTYPLLNDGHGFDGGGLPAHHCFISSFGKIAESGFFYEYIGDQRGDGWFNVEDEQPPKGVPVLVIGGSTAWVDKAYDSDDGISFYEDNYGRATHWMPLPTPPQD